MIRDCLYAKGQNPEGCLLLPQTLLKGILSLFQALKCGGPTSRMVNMEKRATITGIIPQLRTTDMASSIRFYTEKLNFEVEFAYEDFYAGIRAGDQVFHLKLADVEDPSIAYVDEGEHFHLYFETKGIAELAETIKANGLSLVRDVHATPWNTREFVIHDDQGHTLYFGEPISSVQRGEG